MSPKVVKIQTPDGSIIKVEGPDTATDDEFLQQGQLLYQQQQSIKQAQAAKFPTSAELGGKPGAVAPIPEYQGIIGKLAQLGHILADTEPGAATGNESTFIPGLDLLRSAFGSAIPGNAATAGMGTLEAIKASPAAQIAGILKTGITNKLEAAKNAIKGKPADPARIFNQVAGVPAGGKGLEVSKQTGEIITNPGNAPIRVLQAEGKTDAEILKEAMRARPTKALQLRVYAEQQNAGKALEAHLGPAQTPLQIDIPDVKKAKEALKAAGLDQFVNENTAYLNPLEAHKFRSELGQRINWRDTAAPTEANDTLKELWKSVSNQIDEAVPGIAPFNKRWQEAYRYTNSLAHRLEIIGTGKAVPRSAAQEKLIQNAKTAGKVVGATTAGGTILEVLRRLENRP